MKRTNMEETRHNIFGTKITAVLETSVVGYSHLIEKKRQCDQESRTAEFWVLFVRPGLRRCKNLPCSTYVNHSMHNTRHSEQVQDEEKFQVERTNESTTIPKNELQNDSRTN